MLVLNHKDEVEALKASGVAVTIGSFDGVHRGHQHLISVLKKEAAAIKPGTKLAVLTFDPHPERVLSANPPLKLFNKQDQIDVFEDLDIDYLFFIPFDKDLAALTGEQFAQEYIFDLLKPSVVVVGYDFVFGKNRSGNYEILNSMGTKHSTKVQKVEPLKDGEEIISSSLIRSVILQGDMERAAALLGRSYYILGHVIEGRKLGRQLGFPTANISLNGEMTPGLGVYYCTICIGSERFPAVCNVGTNPTVTTTLDRKIECHILDFNQDIYNQRVQILFHRKLREEMTFPNLEALKTQIAADITRARTFV